MKIGRYRFAPPWWGSVLFVVVASLLCALGVWQIERAHTKEQRVAVAQAAAARGPTPMRPAHAASAGNATNDDLGYGQTYIARGRFDLAHQILLNDQIHERRNGYRVWTPLVLDGGVRVMVDRGWIAQGANPQSASPNPGAPAAPVRVQGFWRSFPRPGFSPSAENACSDRAWPRALNYPDAATVRCQYGAPVANGLLLLDPADPNGFARDWAEDEDLVGLAPFGHYAYASQWFLMALVVAIIFVVVNAQRRD